MKNNPLKVQVKILPSFNHLSINVFTAFSIHVSFKLTVNTPKVGKNVDTICFCLLIKKGER